MFANVQDDYNLRIIDFGLAEQLEENTDHVVNISQHYSISTRGLEIFPLQVLKVWLLFILLYNYILDNVYVRDPGVHVTRGDGL